MSGAAQSHGALAGKVAKVTLAFWVIKIIATTLGETGGDALSMPPINLGYSFATYIFLGFFVVTVVGQVAAKRYHPAPLLGGYRGDHYAGYDGCRQADAGGFWNA
jgi:uncharacterized membrane-anchored protein